MRYELTEAIPDDLKEAAATGALARRICLFPTQFIYQRPVVGTPFANCWESAFGGSE
jgi:hypothetical protein